MEAIFIFYLLVNFYLTGVINADEEKPLWWRTLLLLCAASFCFLVPVGRFLDKKLYRFTWYRNLKFWIQLNFLGTFSGYTKEGVYEMERFISKSEDEHSINLKKQWKRVKSKYNY